MFDLSDAILRSDVKKSLEIFRLLIDTMSIDRLLPSLIGLLRNSVYAKYLENRGCTQRESVSILAANPYVIQKAYDSRISFDKMRVFYTKLISIN
jgi:DNA polymerase III delta subunit